MVRELASHAVAWVVLDLRVGLGQLNHAYSGVIISDLTFVEDGNPDVTEDGSINWNKRKLLFTVLSQFLEQQRRSSYRYTIRPSKDQLLMSIDANQLTGSEVIER